MQRTESGAYGESSNVGGHADAEHNGDAGAYCDSLQNGLGLFFHVSLQKQLTAGGKTLLQATDGPKVVKPVAPPDCTTTNLFVKTFLPG